MIKLSGTFALYDPVNNPKAPEFDGFEGGVSYKDNLTKQYVGYGGPCGGYNTVPGFIDTTAANPGCLITACEGGDVFDNKTAFYLLSHPNLTWIKTDIKNTLKIFDAVKIYWGSRPTFMFGRIKVANFYRFGFIWSQDQDQNMFIFKSQNGNAVTSSEFEILSCSSPVESSCGKFVNNI
jgi:hypothetical protein